jgi:hypothetical protein
MASNDVAERNFYEFTLFPNLPFEIQLKIWKYAVPWSTSGKSLFSPRRNPACLVQ